LRKLVEGYFTLKALGPARIKGTSDPVSVYVLLDITERGRSLGSLSSERGRQPAK
jgi:hypothetical protein